MPSSNPYTRLPDSDDIESFSSSYPPPQLSFPISASAKSQGKARAWDLQDEQHEKLNKSESGPKGLNFCVRFTDGTTQDITDLWVTDKETVRDLKKRLRLIRPDSLHDGDKPRRLRLIQLGRMLVDGVFLVPYTLQLSQNRNKLTQSQQAAINLNVREGLESVGRVVKGALEGKDEDRDQVDEMERGEIGGKGKGKEKDGGEGKEEEQIWLHCSVGDAIDDEENAAEQPISTEQTTPLQGFDRLREAGFSEEEIENMRAEFRERRNLNPDEDDDEHQRALEEQWMSGMTGQEEAAGDSGGAGHYVTLLKGVCVGFFVPFLPLFFFRTQLFSRRMQMAIVLGILINLGFGLLRLLG